MNGNNVVWYEPYRVGSERGWGTHYHIESCEQVDKQYYIPIKLATLLKLDLPYHRTEKYKPCSCIDKRDINNA
jgi:hypothetical protein